MRKIVWLPHMKYRLVLSLVLMILGFIGALIYSNHEIEILRWISGTLFFTGQGLIGYELLRSLVNDFTGKILK